MNMLIHSLVRGLRPAREENIRVEREQRGHGQSRIVHSYGHGGSGWTLSFGCAEEVAVLVDGIMKDDRSICKSTYFPSVGGRIRARL